MDRDDYKENIKKTILKESSFRRNVDDTLVEGLTPAEKELKADLERSRRMGKLTAQGQSKLDQLTSKEWR